MIMIIDLFELRTIITVSLNYIASKFTYKDTDQRKPAIPKKQDKPIMGLVSDKNFIVANAVENILAGKLTHFIQSHLLSSS